MSVGAGIQDNLIAKRFSPRSHEGHEVSFVSFVVKATWNYLTLRSRCLRC